MPDRRLLLVTSETFPPIYPSIREIYGRLLPERGYDVGTVFADSTSPGQNPAAWPGRAPLARIASTSGALGPSLVTRQIRRRSQLRALRASVGRREWDLVQVRDDPWLGGLFAAACHRSKTPFVFQLSHLKEEELQLQARLGVYGPPMLNRFKAAIALRLRARVVEGAQLVLAVSDEMRSYLQAKDVRTRIEVLPEGAPSRLLDHVPDASLRRRLGLGDGPLIVYVGTLSQTRRVGFLIEVLKKVRIRHPAARLLVVGHSLRAQDRSALGSQIHGANLGEAIVVAGPVDAAQVPDYIALAQVGVSPLPADLVFRMNSPVKLFEYMALAVPVVASDTPEQRAVIEASGGGFAVSHSVDAFAAAIDNLLDSPAAAAARGRAGRNYVRHERTFDVLTPRLAGYYDALLDRAPASANAAVSP